MPGLIIDLFAGGGGKTDLTAASLCSGFGLGDLGLTRAGYKHVWFCEIRPERRHILSMRWPGIKIYEDTHHVDDTAECPDLLLATFPCKQTSLAAAIHGKRSGLAGADSGVWWDCLRVVRALAPSWVLVENPGGVKTWAGTIQKGLEEVGYTVSRQVLKASDFGAPHERRRMFFVANRDGKRLEVARPAGSPQIGRGPWSTPPRGAWRGDNPGACRVDDGHTNRVDRLQGIGGGCMPVMAEHLGRAIMMAGEVRHG